MKAKKIRFGILGYADIAKRKFIPALLKSKYAELNGIASRSNRKAVKFAKKYETNPHSYESLLNSPDIDAVYIPLPNCLHFDWSLKALFAGKHVLVEKPAVLNKKEAKLIIEAAAENDKCLMEGFMFKYHPQHSIIKEIILNNEIGEIRLFRSSFGFTLKDKNSFRLASQPGSGCLYDGACYHIAAMRFLFGHNPKESKGVIEVNNDGVDLSYAAMLLLDNGMQALINGGYRQQYECFYEILGSRGKIIIDRAYTTPLDMSNSFTLICGKKKENILMKPADHFKNMINYFCQNLNNKIEKKLMLEDLLLQAKGMDTLRAGLQIMEINKNENNKKK
jgi:predicted dehydrogenase